MCAVAAEAQPSAVTRRVAAEKRMVDQYQVPAEDLFVLAGRGGWLMMRGVRFG